MAMWRSEEIERVLERMFWDVLSLCGSEPPQLDRVLVRSGEPVRGHSIIRAEFKAGGAPNSIQVVQRSIPTDILKAKARRYRNGFIYDAGVLWARCYEDHYVRRMRERIRRAMIDAHNSGVTHGVEALRAQYDSLTVHVSDYHDVGYADTLTAATELRQRAMCHPSPSNMRAVAERVNRQTESMLLNALGPTETWSSEQSVSADTIMEMIRAFDRSSRARDHAIRLLDPYTRELLANPRSLFFDQSLEVGTPEAQAKGLELLDANLTEQQRQDYAKHKYFDVKGGASGSTYRIRHGRQMNIEQLDGDGKRVCGWCFLPQGGLVAGDIMLAQKTALELYETEALKIANRF